MAAINFPNNPTPGQQEVYNGVTYTWDDVGNKWVVTEGPFYSGATGATGEVGYGLYAFARVCNLRNKPDAQLEIQELSGIMLELVKNIEGNPFKLTLEAFDVDR